MYAVLDQGLISGSNFLLGILLARWTGAEQYGAYALAFAIFILVSIVYQALVLEPMTVFGPSVYRSEERRVGKECRCRCVVCDCREDKAYVHVQSYKA